MSEFEYKLVINMKQLAINFTSRAMTYPIFHGLPLPNLMFTNSGVGVGYFCSRFFQQYSIHL
ncbi:protein of unknown function [Legionella hackeliae]|uniref:Uncharacterized protein n=1 Tax=Legionella hackeliae TaxID=449 RepID=A0A0A8UR74_LEGHA|nr:protein of unknown function [Legionella hackeliae]